MKKLFLIFICFIVTPVFADEIDDINTAFIELLDKQDQITAELQEDVIKLRKDVKGGEEIIYDLNARITSLLEINKHVTDLNVNFGHLIDDQNAGYKLQILKLRIMFICACILIGGYIVLRVLKLFPNFRPYLFWVF